MFRRRGPELQILCGQCGCKIEIHDAQSVAGLSCPQCGCEIPLESSGAEGEGEADEVELAEDEGGFASQVRQALAGKIRVKCSSCGRGLKVSMRMAGRKTTCPACKKRIRIPYPEDKAEREVERMIAERSGELQQGAPALQQGEQFEQIEQIEQLKQAWQAEQAEKTEQVREGKYPEKVPQIEGAGRAAILKFVVVVVFLGLAAAGAWLLVRSMPLLVIEEDPFAADPEAGVEHHRPATRPTTLPNATIKSESGFPPPAPDSEDAPSEQTYSRCLYLKMGVCDERILAEKEWEPTEGIADYLLCGLHRCTSGTRNKNRIEEA